MKKLTFIFSALMITLVSMGAQAQNSLANEKALFSKARAAFKANKFQVAINEYSKIEKDSLRWPMAKEEKSWAHFRLKQYEKALSDVRSLTNPYMQSQIDLEPFLLQSLILLYNCDYKGVFKTIKDMKEKMAPFVSSMETLGQGQMTEVQTNALSKLIDKKDYRGMLPEEFHELPRRFYLDQIAASALKSGNASQLKIRLQVLARTEDSKNHKMLQFLRLVEVEAIQRAFVPNQFNGKLASSMNKDSNTMVFQNDEELWADEIDKTQADINLCVSKTGRTL
jgi:hypothetical protein